MENGEAFLVGGCKTWSLSMRKTDGKLVSFVWVHYGEGYQRYQEGEGWQVEGEDMENSELFSTPSRIRSFDEFVEWVLGCASELRESGYKYVIA